MLVFKTAVFVQRFVCLSYYKSVFLVRCKIIHAVGYDCIYNLSVGVKGMFNLSVRAHYKAVFVHFGERCKR